MGFRRNMPVCSCCMRTFIKEDATDSLADTCTHKHQDVSYLYLVLILLLLPKVTYLPHRGRMEQIFAIICKNQLLLLGNNSEGISSERICSIPDMAQALSYDGSISSKNAPKSLSGS